MRDMLSNIQIKRAIAPQNIKTNSAVVSAIIDRQGYDSLTFIIMQGANDDTDATFAVLVEDGDDDDLVDDGAAVADTDLISQTPGTAPELAAAFDYADDNQVRSIGYRGTKRYVRLTITPSDLASPGDAFIAAVAILGHASQKPITHAAS